jgi:hypothetical protein
MDTTATPQKANRLRILLAGAALAAVVTAGAATAASAHAPASVPSAPTTHSVESSETLQATTFSADFRYRTFGVRW